MDDPDDGRRVARGSPQRAAHTEPDNPRTEAADLYRRVAALASTTLSLDRAGELGEAARNTGPDEEILATLVDVCGPHPLATAFTASALMAAQAPELAHRFLDTVLVMHQRTESDLEALAAYLNAGQRTDLAVYAFTAASRNSPIQTVLRHSEILRKRGHPEAVRDLLASVAAGRPAEIGRLVTALREARREHEIGPVLDSLATAAPATAAVLLKTLTDEGLEADARSLVDAMADRPFAHLATIAVTVGSPEAAAMLTPALLARPGSEMQHCLNPDQGPLAPHQLDRLAVQIVSAFPTQCPEPLVTWFSRRADAAWLVWLIEHLTRSGAGLDTVLSAVALRPDFESLCEALHQLGHHQFAYHLAALRAEYRS